LASYLDFEFWISNKMRLFITFYNVSFWKKWERWHFIKLWHREILSITGYLLCKGGLAWKKKLLVLYLFLNFVYDLFIFLSILPILTENYLILYVCLNTSTMDLAFSTWETEIFNYYLIFICFDLWYSFLNFFYNLLFDSLSKSLILFNFHNT
jgi:hypothetical protein